MGKSTFLNLENSIQKITENPLTVWHYLTSTPTTHTAVKKVPFVHYIIITTFIM